MGSIRVFVVFLSVRLFVDPSCQETLSAALDAVLEKTQDFTDSAYTSHEHRQAILESSDRLKAELDHLLGLYANVVSPSNTFINRAYLRRFSCFV